MNAFNYNTGNEGDPALVVIGVDATDAAFEAIAAGKMTATVKQDGDAMGQANDAHRHERPADRRPGWTAWITPYGGGRLLRAYPVREDHRRRGGIRTSSHPTEPQAIL